MQGARFFLVIVSAVILLGACSSTPAPRGEVQGMSSGGREMGQSDTNRVATIAMQSNLQSLYLLMDKLYRREAFADDAARVAHLMERYAALKLHT